MGKGKSKSQFAKNNKMEMLSRLYCDIDVDPEELYLLLEGKLDKVDQIDKATVIH